MTAHTDFKSMKPEDLTLELFSLQLELNQVPYGTESQGSDLKMYNPGVSTVATTAVTSAEHFMTNSHRHVFDLSSCYNSEPMMVDTCNQDSYGFQQNTCHQGYPQKSSDEGTVIDEDLMDVIQQTLNEIPNTNPVEIKPITLSPVSEKPQMPVTTPPFSNTASPCGSYYGGHSSQGGPPTPPDLSGRKKKLKTKHVRDTVHSQVLAQKQGNESFNIPFETPPTPATPNTTPISSCPSSPNGFSGYVSQGSNKSTSSRGKAGEQEVNKLPRHKRPSHIKAEHKRRNKIQGGIEELQRLVPSMGEAGTKESKSNILYKAVEYTRQLEHQTKGQLVEMERLRSEIEALKSEINAQQENLPAEGAVCAVQKPDVKNHPASQLTCQQMFNDYVNSRSLSNWKFWLFGLLIRPLFNAYESSVDPATTETLQNGVIGWCKKHCSLVALRPAIFNFLRDLTERTSVRTRPERLPDEIIQMVIAENFPTADNKPPQESSYK